MTQPIFTVTNTVYSFTANLLPSPNYSVSVNGTPINVTPPGDIIVTATNYVQNVEVIPNGILSILEPSISTVDIFTGNGIQTNFQLSKPLLGDSFAEITIGGVVQTPNDAYTVYTTSPPEYTTATTTIIFNSPPPPIIDGVVVRYYSIIVAEEIVGATGPSGPTGARGPTGPTGAPGLSGYIGIGGGGIRVSQAVSTGTVVSLEDLNVFVSETTPNPGTQQKQFFLNVFSTTGTYHIRNTSPSETDVPEDPQPPINGASHRLTYSLFSTSTVEINSTPQVWATLDSAGGWSGSNTYSLWSNDNHYWKITVDYILYGTLIVDAETNPPYSYGTTGKTSDYNDYFTPTEPPACMITIERLL